MHIRLYIYIYTYIFVLVCFIVGIEIDAELDSDGKSCEIVDLENFRISSLSFFLFYLAH